MMSRPIPPMALSRRQLLRRSSAITGLAVITGLGLPSLALADAPLDGFMALSGFLTGRPTMDTGLGARFLAALIANDASFAARMAALSGAIKGAAAPTMDAFLARPDNDKAVMATAKEIVSAWYMGTVGTGEKAVLISFKEALMFAPTKNYGFVPSYGGGPDSWVPTPPFSAG